MRHTALGVIYGNAEGSCSDICGAGVHQLEYLHTGSGNAMPDYKYCNYIVQFEPTPVRRRVMAST